MKYFLHTSLLIFWGFAINQIQNTESTLGRWGYAGVALSTVFVAIVVEAYFKENEEENAYKIRSRKRFKKG